MPEKELRVLLIYLLCCNMEKNVGLMDRWF